MKAGKVGALSSAMTRKNLCFRGYLLTDGLIFFRLAVIEAPLPLALTAVKQTNQSQILLW